MKRKTGPAPGVSVNRREGQKFRSETRPKEVGIWVRVSTEEQVESESPEHHEQRARMYAEAKGWKVARVYTLNAVSGKSVMGRPETEQMFDDVREGRISGLVFSKLARLARNTKELLEFAEFFRAQDADLISLQESIDTSTPAGRFFYTLIAGMAQWEREEIADRVAASVPIRAKLGKPLGGAAPFGYRWNEGTLGPDATEAPIRRLIYELFSKHRRLKTVARLMNEAGHRTRKGAKFSDTTVRRLIEDPIAKGTRRVNYTKSTGAGKRWQLKPEEDWVLSPIKPIVSDELWAECNHFLAQRKNGRKPARKTKHVFAGLVWCQCSTKMYVPSNSPKYICHDCRNKVPADDLETVFAEQLKGFFLSKEQVTEYLAQGDRVQTEKEELLQGLVREKAKLQTEMDRVYRLYIDDEIDSKGFGRRNRPMEERFQQLESEIPRLQGEIDFLKINNLASAEIVSEARDLYSRWQDLSVSDRRTIVENLVQRITIGKTEIDIDLCYMPPLPPAPLPKSMTERQRNNKDSSRPRAGIERGS